MTLDRISFDELRTMSVEQARAYLEGSIGQWQESERLDFKLRYDRNKNSEIAKDIGALANLNGGRILVGAVDENNILKELPGFPLADAAQELARIEQVAGSRLEEPVSALRTCVLKISDDSAVIVVDVPRSLKRPHAVRLENGDYGFPRRTGTQTEWMTAIEFRRLYRFEIETQLKSVSRLEWILREIMDELPAEPIVLMYASPAAVPEDEILRSTNEWFDRFKIAMAEIDCQPFPVPGNMHNFQIASRLDRWICGAGSRRLLVYRNGVVAAWQNFSRNSSDKNIFQIPLGEIFARAFVTGALSIIPSSYTASGTIWGLRILNCQGWNLHHYDDWMHQHGEFVGTAGRNNESTEFRIDDADPRARAIAEYVRRYNLAFGYEPEAA